MPLTALFYHKQGYLSCERVSAPIPAIFITILPRYTPMANFIENLRNCRLIADPDKVISLSLTDRVALVSSADMASEEAFDTFPAITRSKNGIVRVVWRRAGRKEKMLFIGYHLIEFNAGGKMWDIPYELIRFLLITGILAAHPISDPMPHRG